MPRKPKKPCPKHPHVLLDVHDRCPQCLDIKRRTERARPSATRRGYGYRWQKQRLHYLQAHPLCVMCQADDMITAATVVDHIKPHKGNDALMWDQNNWQALCKTCHDRKTATQDNPDW